ncbi:hypothetical protein [Actinoplanes sp. NPDC049681]|uniref:hypothetical protein n=1 Tax=Actinoplanes sp. NPDC049681 TaxID=3363905 RepID=UPI003789DCDB
MSTLSLNAECSTVLDASLALSWRGNSRSLDGEESVMDEVGFVLWDAPKVGQPRLDLVSTSWHDEELLTVTLSRSAGAGGDIPDVSIWSAKTLERSGLTLSALLPFTRRYAETHISDQRDAAKALELISMASGTPTEIKIGGAFVSAERYEVPGTKDWVVTATDPSFPVSVAGIGGHDVPELEVADMVLWRWPIEDQTIQARDAARSQRRQE